MKRIRIFDNNHKSLKIGSYLAYTEDANPKPQYDYADSLVVLTAVDNEYVSLKTIIYNRASHGHDFHQIEQDDSFSLSIFTVIETADGIDLILKDHYLMENQSDPSVEDLEYQLNQIRGIAA
jgi:hypothetical protein